MSMTPRQFGDAIAKPFGLVQAPSPVIRPLLVPPTTGVRSIAGIVRAQNVVASRVVELYDLATMFRVAQTTSDGGGNYSFTGLDETRSYRVIVLGIGTERDVTIEIS